MTFDEFVAPLGERAFMAQAWGRQPVHLPAPSRPRLSFGWPRMNDLFAIAPHWTEGNLKLILNSRPIEPQFYIDEVQTFDGPVRRADPAKIDLFLSIGASLVANAVEAVAPEIAALTEMLAARFHAVTGANIYCSFDGVQAFDTHYDTHEVFALQCEGEKTWNLYRNREPDSLDPPQPGSDTQESINAARGPLGLQITMRPGDLLYIPRGYYHDALAQRGSSLHVTFAVAPRTGRMLAQLLGDAIHRDAAFSADLPSPDEEDGALLSSRLNELADRLADIVRSPAFAIEVSHLQRKAALPRLRTSLPERPPSQYYSRTNVAADLRQSLDGTILVVAGRRHDVGTANEIAAYALARPAFSAREIDTRFAHVPAKTRLEFIDLLLRERLVEPYTPQI